MRISDLEIVFLKTFDVADAKSRESTGLVMLSDRKQTSLNRCLRDTMSAVHIWRQTLAHAHDSL